MLEKILFGHEYTENSAENMVSRTNGPIVYMIIFKLTILYVDFCILTELPLFFSPSKYKY
jgi:hypothetical protein